MTSDFFPTADLQRLRRRAAVLQALRSFFGERGFLEVETPLLSRDTVIDSHLEPLRLADDSAPLPGRWWLQTSPEFCMKRLLAAGAEKIYQVTRAFRGGERGRLHNVEFTIAEWYERDADYEQGMRRLGELATVLLSSPPVERLAYREAFKKHANIDPFSADLDAIAAATPEADRPQRTVDDDRDMWLDILLTSVVQPQLGIDRPLILYDYPASQAALARVRDETHPVAERFELFYRGIELANGYHELTDPEELRRRNAWINRQRIDAGLPRLPEESRLLAAMDHGLPPSAGCALGVDRLVLLRVEADHIDQVLAFPTDRA